MKPAIIKERCILSGSGLQPPPLTTYRRGHQSPEAPRFGPIRLQRTDQQKDEDGENHHEGSVPIEGNSLDETRLEDFIPPGFKGRRQTRAQRVKMDANTFLTNVPNK